MQREKKKKKKNTLPNVVSFLQPEQRRHVRGVAAVNETPLLNNFLEQTEGSLALKVCATGTFYGLFCSVSCFAYKWHVFTYERQFSRIFLPVKTCKDLWRQKIFLFDSVRTKALLLAV